jgi:hypothetical protein
LIVTGESQGKERKKVLLNRFNNQEAHPQPRKKKILLKGNKKAETSKVLNIGVEGHDVVDEGSR